MTEILLSLIENAIRARYNRWMNKKSEEQSK